MTRTLSRTTLVLGLALSMLVGALAVSVFSRLDLADAKVNDGERPVMITVDIFRIRDTRNEFGGPIGGPAAPLGPASSTVIQVGGVNGIPSDATAVVVNLTAIGATTETFVTAHASDQPRPNSSTLNPGPGTTSVNGVIVPLSSDGRMTIYNNAGSVDFFVDVAGYFVDHDHDDRLGAGPNAVSMSGYEVRLDGGEEQVIGTSGPVELSIRCVENQGGDDIIQLWASGTRPYIVGYSNPGGDQVYGANSQVLLHSFSQSTGDRYTDAAWDVFGVVVSDQGHMVSLNGEGAIVALNTFGSVCYSRGVVDTLPATTAG